jgi:hypothetical protein
VYNLCTSNYSHDRVTQIKYRIQNMKIQTNNGIITNEWEKSTVKGCVYTTLQIAKVGDLGVKLDKKDLFSPKEIKVALTAEEQAQAIKEKKPFGFISNKLLTRLIDMKKVYDKKNKGKATHSLVTGEIKL